MLRPNTTSVMFNGFSTLMSYQRNTFLFTTIWSTFCAQLQNDPCGKGTIQAKSGLHAWLSTCPRTASQSVPDGKSKGRDRNNTRVGQSRTFFYAKKAENTPSHVIRIANNLHNVCTDDTFRGATDRPKGRSFAEGIERSSGEHNVFSYIIAAEASDIPCGPRLSLGFFLRRSLHMQGLDKDKWECLRLTVVKVVLWPVSILLGLCDALSYIVYEEPSDYRAAPPGTLPLRHIPILKVPMDRRRRPPHQ